MHIFERCKGQDCNRKDHCYRYITEELSIDSTKETFIVDNKCNSFIDSSDIIVGIMTNLRKTSAQIADKKQ